MAAERIGSDALEALAPHQILAEVEQRHIVRLVMDDVLDLAVDGLDLLRVKRRHAFVQQLGDARVVDDALVGVAVDAKRAGDVAVVHAVADGVDQSLLKHFVAKIAKKTDQSEAHLLRTKTAQVEILRQACNILLMILGGPIGAISLRLAIALSGVNHFIGGVISIFIDDDSEKLKPTHKNPLKDMLHITKTTAKNPMLRRRIVAYAVAREMTHGIIWVITPLFLKAGVPMSIVSFAWAGNSLMAILGAHLANKYGKNLSDSVALAIPVTLMTVSMTIMALNLNIITVWLYGLMGITQGWTAATMTPMVQRYAKPSEQTSVLSITKMLAQLLYIPAVWVIGLAADIELTFGLLATVAIFLPLGLISIKKLTNPA